MSPLLHDAEIGRQRALGFLFSSQILASGAVVPIVDRTFPLAQAAEAHAYMAGNTSFGKVVLTVP